MYIIYIYILYIGYFKNAEIYHDISIYLKNILYNECI